MRTRRLRWIPTLLSLVLVVPAFGQDAFKPVWPQLSPSEREEVDELGEEFKTFIGSVRSHLQFVRQTAAAARREGFREWSASVTSSQMTPGSKWFAINRDRTIALFVIGREPLEKGLRIVNTHIDSPRLELKTRPIREKNGAVLFDTTVAGGIKNYQWINVPLAMIGRVDRTDGETIWIEIGFDPDDPVLLITDLAPHVDRDYRSRTQRDVIATEELDPIVATLPGGDDVSLTDSVLALLKERFGIEGGDLLSAEIQLVPATRPRDVGLDRALVGAYGQDDRSTAWASLRSIMELGTPRYTAVAYAVNNEEGGRSWNTGVASSWFETQIAEMIAVQSGTFSELALRRAFANSDVLVSDCTTALNPLFPAPQNDAITSRLGYGMVIKEYGVAKEANSEFFAEIRRLLDEAGVRWQTHSYDAGYGGGTIAAAFAELNMDVIDVGIGLVSMHSPFEVSSKADLWELYRAFNAFYRQE